jgi:hypothetical protein
LWCWWGWLPGREARGKVKEISNDVAWEMTMDLRVFVAQVTGVC